MTCDGAVLINARYAGIVRRLRMYYLLEIAFVARRFEANAPIDRPQRLKVPTDNDYLAAIHSADLPFNGTN